VLVKEVVTSARVSLAGTNRDVYIDADAPALLSVTYQITWVTVAPCGRSIGSVNSELALAVATTARALPPALLYVSKLVRGWNSTPANVL
jgi:hypothetical protein